MSDVVAVLIQLCSLCNTHTVIHALKAALSHVMLMAYEIKGWISSCTPC